MLLVWLFLLPLLLPLVLLLLCLLWVEWWVLGQGRRRLFVMSWSWFLLTSLVYLLLLWLLRLRCL
jgi:hypothetical protein